MVHDTIKILLEPSYSYSDFDGWYDSLDAVYKDLWVEIAKTPLRIENNEELLVKKAVELYCIEMDIDFLPNDEKYLQKIYQRFITNLIFKSLERRGLIKLVSGKLSFVKNSKFELTENGKIYMQRLK